MDLSGLGTGAAILGGLLVATVAVLVGLALSSLLRWLTRRWELAGLGGPTWRSPVVALVTLGALNVYNDLVEGAWRREIDVALEAGIIAAAAWLVLRLITMLEQAALDRFPDKAIDDLDSRYARTQIILIRRVAVALVIVAAIGGILWLFQPVREVGAGLLASAGFIGIVAGLAAQSVLGNMFAGIQIALSDGIRIGDVVDLDGRGGRIDSIRLTHVAMRRWDGSSLILPSTYFTTTPFTNRTHAGAHVRGQVDFAVDWTVPVEEVRAHLLEVVRELPDWDGELVSLVVEDTSGTTVLLRAYIGTNYADRVFALEREVREALLLFLQQRPQLFPQERVTENPPGHDPTPTGSG